MRDSVESIYWPTAILPNGCGVRLFTPSARDIEEKVRTFMLAGTDPAELRAKADAVIAEQQAKIKR
jgi:non-ribosomal peptide synthetase component F